MCVLWLGRGAPFAVACAVRELTRSEPVCVVSRLLMPLSSLGLSARCVCVCVALADLPTPDSALAGSALSPSKVGGAFFFGTSARARARAPVSACDRRVRRPKWGVRFFGFSARAPNCRAPAAFSGGGGEGRGERVDQEASPQ